MSIKAITFDLDDTLWHNQHAIPEAERRTFEYLVTHCPNISNFHSIESIRRLIAQVLAEQPEFIHRISRLRIVALTRALIESGYADDVAQRHAQAAFDIFLDARHQVTFFTHALQILEQLHNRFQLGALTNGNADINRLPIKPYFDFSFCAEEFGSSKPDPTLFRAALDHTGLQPEQCIHVGDNYDHDVIGARQAGFHAIWVNFDGKPSPDNETQTDEVRCLSELPGAIDAIISRI